MERAPGGRQLPSVARVLGFVGLWAAAGVLPALAAMSLPFDEHPRLSLALTLVVGWGLAPLPLQALALRLFASWGKRWVVASLVAVLPGALFASGGSMLLGYLLGGAQWFALRGKVKYAALWPATVCATSSLRLLGLAGALHAEPPSLVPFVLSSALEAGLMLYLLDHALATGPAVAQAPVSAADVRGPAGTTTPHRVAERFRVSPQREQPAPLRALPASARVSLGLFLALAALVTLSVIHFSPPRGQARLSFLTWLFLWGLTLVAWAVLAFVSLIQGARSLATSRRALLWMVPTAILLLLAPLFFVHFLGLS